MPSAFSGRRLSFGGGFEWNLTEKRRHPFLWEIHVREEFLMTAYRLVRLTLLCALIGVCGVLVRAEETKFPSSYDPNILQEIGKSPLSKFSHPIVTVLHLDSASAHDTQTVSVWMQLKVGTDLTVREARVVYCSVPAAGFEKSALENIRNCLFAPLEGKDTVAWLWHEVLFLGKNEQMPPNPSTDSIIIDWSLPEMRYAEKLVYPPDARTSGLTGKVWINVLVDVTGAVQFAVVARSSGVASLDSSALDAAYECLYAPTNVDGKAVPVWTQYKVKFSLDK
jgi:TonB family protein